MVAIGSNRARRFLARRQGQSTVEYMLYVSVIIVGFCATAYIFIGPLDSGWDKVKNDITVVMDAEEETSGDLR